MLVTDMANRSLPSPVLVADITSRLRQSFPFEPETATSFSWSCSGASALLSLHAHENLLAALT